MKLLFLFLLEMSERPQPLKAVNRLFEGKEPWQIVTMTASSVLALVWAHSLYNGKESMYLLLLWLLLQYFVNENLRRICLMWGNDGMWLPCWAGSQKVAQPHYIPLTWGCIVCSDKTIPSLTAIGQTRKRQSYIENKRKKTNLLSVTLQ